MDSSPIIDLSFPAHGRGLPVDHGYALFSALARALEPAGVPWLHDCTATGIHPIRGTYAGLGRLALNEGARLTIRLPAQDIPRWLPLAGQTIQVGTDPLRIGIPQPHALVPAPCLYAHLVTTRNGEDEARFDTEIARQLAELNVSCRAARLARCTFTLKGKHIVAHRLQLSDLTAEDSLRVQATGLGGRRKLGCGLFLPKA